MDVFHVFLNFDSFGLSTNGGFDDFMKDQAQQTGMQVSIWKLACRLIFETEPSGRLILKISCFCFVFVLMLLGKVKAYNEDKKAPSSEIH